MKRLLVLTVGMLAWTGLVVADDAAEAARLNREANRLYREGRMEEALSKYSEALAVDPDEPALRYNLGNALYRLERYDEASGEFDAAAGPEAEPSGGEGGQVALDALYNHGSTRLRMEDYAGAVEALREVLLRAPGDDDARRNLEVALARLVEQQEQEQQQEQQDSGEPRDQQQQESGKGEDQDEPESKDPSSPEPSEPRSPDEPDPEAAPPERSGGSDPDEGEQDAQPQPRDGEERELGEEEARRLLEALAQDERAELKESLERRPRKKGKSDRDW